MKKLFKLFLTLTVVFCLCLTYACGDNSQNNNNGGSQSFNRYSPVDKVVLFIGDGMGYNHVYNTELSTNSKMCFSGWETQIAVETNSLSGVTDSAASATALATGKRTENGFVGMLSDQTVLTSITELAKGDGLGAGVVTSDNITGATPAGFTAHTPSRDDSFAVLTSQLNNPLDFIIGSGGYYSYREVFRQKGFSYVNSFSELNNNSGRFIASFSDVVSCDPTNYKPTLTQLATFAVNFMEANYKNGYFLMIEGAKIDKKSHYSTSRSIEDMMQEVVDFNNAVSAVSNIISGDYALIVTADHETGGLLKADSKDQLTNSLFTTSDHTGQNVPLYFKSSLTTIPEVLQKQIIVNTEVFSLCKYLLAL